MELLKDMPLRLAQWLLQEYLPDIDDDDYTPWQLLNYDPRGAFADNIGDMTKDDAIDALSAIIERLTPFTKTEAAPPQFNWRHLAYTDEGFALREDYLLKLNEDRIISTAQGGLNGSYDEYIDEHSDADPGL